MDDKTQREHAVRYFVNAEQETTTFESLSVGEILELAGFTPVTDYLLKSENPPQDYENHYDESVHIHEDQRFGVRYKGPTATS